MDKIANPAARILGWIKTVDVLLLLFLCLFTIDKVTIKPVVLGIAIVAVGRRLQWKDVKSVPLFYWFIAFWGLVNFVGINHDFSTPHFIAFGIGMCYWLMAGVAYMFVRNRVANGASERLMRTADGYFYLNALWSVANLVIVIVRSHTFNPYLSANTAYGSSTGDYIRGLPDAPSFVNMFISSFYCIYFLYRGKHKSALLAAAICFLTTSNFATIIFLPVLAAMFFVLKKKQTRLMVSGIFALFLVFTFFISSDNLGYMFSSVKKSGTNSLMEQPDSIPRIRNRAAYTAADSMFRTYRYGKILSFLETYRYATSGPVPMLFGAGIGEFSSQLAERTSDLPVVQKSRLFAHVPVYVAPAFYDNHYKIFYNIYSIPTGYHSIMHFPTSSFNQLLGEYGIVGLLLFFVFYLGHFVKEYKTLRYTWPMLALICGYFLFTYLFEFLSVTVFFEFFFLLDVKQTKIGANG